MGLVLDAYGRPVLHPGDVIAIREFNGRSFESKVREPLRVTRITRADRPETHEMQCNVVDTYAHHGTFRIYFKEAMSSREEWVFSHDIEVKLLARHS